MKRTLILAAALLAACPLTCFGQSNHSDTTMKQNPNLTASDSHINNLKH